jgi:hypothetical protein
MPVTTNRLQLPLLLEHQLLRQPLPPDVRKKSVEIIARMLREVLKAEAREADYESR